MGDHDANTRLVVGSHVSSIQRVARMVARRNTSSPPYICEAEISFYPKRPELERSGQNDCFVEPARSNRNSGFGVSCFNVDLRLAFRRGSKPENDRRGL